MCGRLDNARDAYRGLFKASQIELSSPLQHRATDQIPIVRFDPPMANVR